MAAPINYRGACAAVWQCRPDVWLTLLWDVPDAAEIQSVTREWERAVVVGVPYRSVVDVRNVRYVDAVAFAALAGQLRSRRSDLLPLLRGQAIVRSDGVIGAMAMGLLAVVGWRAPVRIFTDVAAALSWLLPGDEAIPGEYARWQERNIVDAPLLTSLRNLLQARCADIDPARAARSLGMSLRTLQRQLAASATSFSDELARARLGKAKELLASSEEKIDVIAGQVGFASASHFGRFFAAATGEAPSGWRARRR